MTRRRPLGGERGRCWDDELMTEPSDGRGQVILVGLATRWLVRYLRAYGQATDVGPA